MIFFNLILFFFQTFGNFSHEERPIDEFFNSSLQTIIIKNDVQGCLGGVRSDTVIGSESALFLKDFEQCLSTSLVANNQQFPTVKDFNFTKQDYKKLKESLIEFTTIDPITGAKLPNQERESRKTARELYNKVKKVSSKDLNDFFQSDQLFSDEWTFYTSKNIVLINEFGDSLFIESSHNQVSKPFDLPRTIKYNNKSYETYNLAISKCLHTFFAHSGFFDYSNDRGELLFQIARYFKKK